MLAKKSSELRVKSSKSKTTEAVSSRAKRRDLINQIATSPTAPRNDKGTSKPRGTSLSVPVYSLVGSKTGFLSLPKEIFGVEVNERLLAQALRVYTNNLKGHFSNTKTRGEVEGSTKKIFKQKGTGRARHGGIRAPIFVGGGIALGPKYRKVILDLPKKMKKAALISALADKAKERGILGVEGLEKATGKTKEMANLASRLWEVAGGKNKQSLLFITDKKIDNASRAAKNLKGVEVKLAKELNAYEVIRYQTLVFTKDAVNNLVGKEDKKA